MISEAFDISKKIRIYNFYGFEIIEDADLSIFRESLEKYKIIYFTRMNDYFENKNLMRVFKIKKKVGEGGFGKVYLAEQKHTKINYAIKFFRHNFTSVKEINFLYKEIEALKRLDHVNIIKFYTYCLLDDEKLALILEYASGGTLRGIKNY
jgi:serine/threonine protein kinase